MPSEPNLLPKARWHLGAVTYPDVPMPLYVHGLDDKLAEITKV
jgi:hypothetical protein